MRKIIIALTILVGFALNANAQQVIKVFSDTVGNSQTKTMYVNLDAQDNFATVDSVVLTGYFAGEIDIDRLITYYGIQGITTTYDGSQDTTTLTVNLDSANYSLSVLATIGLADIKGKSIIKATITSAAAGNDSGDPNVMSIYAFIYRSKK